MRLRPTLIIGAGGTGYEAVVRVKARFRETFPAELLEQIRYIVFDTDTNHPPVRSSVGEVIELEPGLELFQIGGVPVKGIIENHNNYPEIAAELDLKRLPRLDLTKGAKQVRQLGRLAFFYHFQRIRRVLEAALRDVLNIAHYSRNTASVQAINCFFISSACGGTGSGIMLDLAYLTRHLAHKWGIPTDYIHTTGMIVLPEAFTKIPASNEAQVRANASAMLAEIDHFMVHGDFRAAYPDKTRVNDSRPPFNITYLVDASNERNQTVEDLNQLTPIMAEALFLQAGSYLGAQVDSAFDNIPTSTSQDIHGHIRAYSMVGASTLRFNAHRMRNACAFRMVKSLVEDVFTKEVADANRRYTDEHIHSEVADHVQAFLSATGLTTDALKQNLRQMEGTTKMIVGLNTEMFDRVTPQAIVRKVENACARYAQDTVNGRFLKQIEINQRRMADDASIQLSQSVEHLLDGLESGIPLAHHFLDGVITSLAPLRRQLQQEREAAQQQLARAQRDIQRSYEIFDEAAQKFNFWGLYKRTLRQSRQRYTEHQRRYLQRLLDQAIVNQGLTLLEAIEIRAQRRLGLLTTLRASLEKVAGDAQHDLDVLLTNWRPTHVTEEMLDHPEAAAVFYERYLNESITNEGRELVQVRPLSGWLRELEQANPDEVSPQGITEDGLTEWMRGFAFGRFERIVRDETVEKQIQDMYTTERDRRSRLQSLIGLGSPFSNYETTSSGQGSEDLDQILVVGVRDKNTSIFSGVQLRDASLVSTFDNYRISVLYTKHGLPLYGLRQYGEYKKHFAAQQATSRAGSIPLFGFKVVQQESRVRSWYAQAEAFGLIGRKGSMGYALDCGNGEIVTLGEDLRTALEKTVGDEALHQPLRRAIGKWLEQHSHRQAMEALTKYMNADRRAPMPLHDELCLIAQSEYDRHQRLSRT